MIEQINYYTLGNFFKQFKNKCFLCHDKISLITSDELDNKKLFYYECNNCEFDASFVSDKDNKFSAELKSFGICFEKNLQYGKKYYRLYFSDNTLHLHSSINYSLDIVQKEISIDNPEHFFRSINSLYDIVDDILNL